MSSIVLHENSHGVRIERTDYKKRSKVDVRSENGYLHKTYRFNNLPVSFSSPYISWANLDCCNGWRYDEEYLLNAVQQGKKLYAGIDFRTETDTPFWGAREPREVVLKRIADMKASLPDGVVIGTEIDNQEWGLISIYICRKGKLSDYYDPEKVLEFYQMLDLFLSEADKQRFVELCGREMADFGNAIYQGNPDYDCYNPRTVPECIITGLLLGYPLESTASFIMNG